MTWLILPLVYVAGMIPAYLVYRKLMMFEEEDKLEYALVFIMLWPLLLAVFIAMSLMGLVEEIVKYIRRK